MCSADSMKKTIPYPNFITMPFIFKYWIQLGFKFFLFVVVVQWVSHVQLFVNPWTAASQASLSFTICQSLLKVMSTESVVLSKPLILCCPLLLLPSVFLSIRVFPNGWSLCTRWTQYWSFSFNISPSNEYSGWLSFRIDWFDLLAVQGALDKYSPAPQFKSINSSTLSLLYGSTLTSIHASWENHSFDGITTSVSKVMLLLLNTLFRFVIAFLPKSKHLLSSRLQSLSTVILEPKKIKSETTFTFSSSICHEMMGPDVMIFTLWMLSFKPAFSVFSFTLIRKLYNSLHFLPLGLFFSVFFSFLLHILFFLSFFPSSFASFFLSNLSFPLPPTPVTSLT